MAIGVTLQQISGLLDQRFSEFEKMLDKKLDQRFSEFEKMLDKKLDQRFLEFEQKMDQKFDQKFAVHEKILLRHEKILRQHSKYLKSLKKDQNLILGVLDREQMYQRKRLDRVENHLGLPPLVA